MVFASLPFIFGILPLFLFSDFLIKNRIYLRNLCICLISLFFYVFDGGFHSLKILIAYGILNYVFGYLLEIAKEKGKVSKNISLVVFVSINLLSLAFYKYSYWLVSLFQDYGLLMNVHAKKQALPLGISFFTFHAISYLIDIARGELNGRNKVIPFLTYFFMFPHLIAGPIVRYKQVQNALYNRESTNSELFSYGLYRFVLGVNKKILIANSVAPIANMAFIYNVDAISNLDAWIGAIAYMIQIYFDFSGYSDMAIGLAAMAGFRFSENFNMPYQSKSIREFWRRWHMSLSSWLRDYVYIPLGGSRVSTFRIYTNLVIVFFLCGLWHGANMTFVVWGLYNGLFLVLERLFLGNILDRLPKVLSHSYAVLVVLIGWVFFRADSLSQAIEYLKVMFFISNTGNESICIGESLNYLALILGVIIVFLNLKGFCSSDSKEHAVPKTGFIVNTGLFLLSIISLYFCAQNPFIYFNF
ncbi:alginate O-acetyltransferase complex protein AlgI [Succinivibrio dextrinosolvens]|uniref:MBOAT family O-acyltransferase n=1 Tax=Succinivibrio dextrinosolvens TaxID=83771 RepID=UPI0008EC7870|nr:MBOAT family O-acyltransferase [Succinivibrio dextrinosolvens]SFS85879.1 alginate O-acetyltransferase complex protein AlgI [Succinivibrio dextrinosolvens]